ncbi:MAG: AAA family ATPase [Pseudonocardiaceae bacterium]
MAGRAWEPHELAALLGADLTASRAHSAGLATGEPAPDPLPGLVKWALEHPGTTDRSAAHHRLVAACHDAGLTRAQTLTVVAGYPPSIEKYGDRLAEEVDRSWSGVDDDRRRAAQAGDTPLRGLAALINTPAAQAPEPGEASSAAVHTAGAEPPEDFGDGDVAERVQAHELARELARLRVRDAARRAFAAEQAGHVDPPAPVALPDLLAEPDEATEYRVGGLWPMGGRVILAAQYKSGKTTLVGNLVRCLVDGEPFLGRHEVATPAGQVVLLDTEMSRGKLRYWLRDQRITTPQRVTVVPLRGRVSSLNPLDPALRAEWSAILRRLGAEVLILDCLRPVLDSLGLDENHDTGRVLVALDELAASAGVGEFALIHHMGHAGERSRGDSRLRDWPDAEWRIIRADDDPASPRFFTAYGRDVEVPETALQFDPATRRITAAGGSRKATVAGAAVRACSICSARQATPGCPAARSRRPSCPATPAPMSAPPSSRPSPRAGSVPSRGHTGQRFTTSRPPSKT